MPPSITLHRLWSPSTSCNITSEETLNHTTVTGTLTAQCGIGNLKAHSILWPVAPKVWWCCQKLQGNPKLNITNGFNLNVAMSFEEMEEMHLVRSRWHLGRDIGLCLSPQGSPPTQACFCLVPRLCPLLGVRSAFGDPPPVPRLWVSLWRLKQKT